MVLKLNPNQILTKVMLVCAAFMVALTGELGIGVTKYCTFAITVFCFMKVLYARISPTQLFLLVTIALSTVLTIYVQKNELVYGVIFVGSLLLMLSLCGEGLEATEWKWLKTCALATAAWFIFLYFFDETAIRNEKLLFHFSNPNMSGIALCGIGMVQVLISAEEHRRLRKLVYLAITGMFIYMLYLTENRGSFFTLLILAVAAVLTTVPKKPIRITSNWVYIVLKLMPILMMLFVVFLYSVLPHDLRVMDKPLFSGREKGWQIALEQLISNPLAYHRFEDGTLNLFLDGAVLYGLVAAVCYFWMLFQIRKPDLRKVSDVSYLAYLGFHLCFIQQSFESTLITGSYNIYIWTYMLLGVAFMKQQQPLVDAPKTL